MSDVTTAHPQYSASSDAWALVADAVVGQDAVKAAGTRYLPKPNPLDTSEENTKRYEQYLLRALYYNVVGRTLTGATGSVFRKPAEVSVPAALDAMLDNVDGSGVELQQQSRRVFQGVMTQGRAALWVDYPPVSEVSKADAVQPVIHAYSAASVINWRVDAGRLSLVVIREAISQVDGDFGHAIADQYRVLLLRDGVYQIDVWREDESGWAVAETYAPTQGSGAYWEEIPFTFVGAANNDAEIDQSPLLDLAHLNIAHYRNSADYEDSVYLVGQPQPWISGLDEHWRDHLQKSGIYIGSRAPMLLPKGGAFGFAQVLPNAMSLESMRHKEAQMLSIGAKLYQPSGVAKTATEASNDAELSHSVISLVAHNVSAAYAKALQWAASYANTSGEIGFNLNQDLVESRLDAHSLTALIGAYQSGQLPSTDLWANLRRAGLIDAGKSDEQIRDELEGEAPGVSLE